MQGRGEKCHRSDICQALLRVRSPVPRNREGSEEDPTPRSGGGEERNLYEQTVFTSERQLPAPRDGLQQAQALKEGWD